MKPQEFRERVRGVIAFPITPFRQDLSLDLDGLRGNLDALMRHPIGAVVAAGPVRPPLPPLRPEDAAEVAALVERWRPMIV